MPSTVPLFLCQMAGCAVIEHRFTTGGPRAAAWGYDGDVRPERWGDLCPTYGLAKTGREQSPVELDSAIENDLPELAFDYRPTRIASEPPPAAEADSPCTVALEGKEYSLEQFHFHSPSEHTSHGQHSALELHFVHGSEDGVALAVGVLIDSGAPNPAFDPLLDPAPGRIVDVGALLPVDRGYFRYTGSLTMPPCTEGVRWVVLRTPVELSDAQIRGFRAIVDGNSRPVQPLNGRTIEVSRRE